VTAGALLPRTSADVHRARPRVFTAGSRADRARTLGEAVQQRPPATGRLTGASSTLRSPMTVQPTSSASTPSATTTSMSPMTVPRSGSTTSASVRSARRSTRTSPIPPGRPACGPARRPSGTRSACCVTRSSRTTTRPPGRSGGRRARRPTGSRPWTTGSAMLRGEIRLVDLEPIRGSEAGKRRPAVVVSDDRANAAAARLGRGVVTVVPVTSNSTRVLPFQTLLRARDTACRSTARRRRSRSAPSPSSASVPCSGRCPRRR
jgi:mRNA interferase MazF